MRIVKLASNKNTWRFICDACGNAIDVTAKSNKELHEKLDDEYVFMHY
jgi:Fe2+ or Zn2+ uptake regulation protein